MMAAGLPISLLMFDLVGAFPKNAFLQSELFGESCFLSARYGLFRRLEPHFLKKKRDCFRGFAVGGGPLKKSRKPENRNQGMVFLLLLPPSPGPSNAKLGCIA